MVKLGAKTIWLKTADILARKFESPAYAALIECIPAKSVEVVNVATAPLFSVPVPSVVVPSRKATVPVGVPEVLVVIVAVNVTGAPLEAEGAELSNAAVVAAGAIVSTIAAEVLLAKLALPAYLQAIE
jgi:hypothetical protein